MGVQVREANEDVYRLSLLLKDGRKLFLCHTSAIDAIREAKGLPRSSVSGPSSKGFRARRSYDLIVSRGPKTPLFHNFRESG